MQKWWRRQKPHIRRRAVGWLLIGVGIGLALAAIPGAVWVALFMLCGIVLLVGWFVSRKHW